MILTGYHIRREIARGALHIAPFRPECVQPNGYDFHLGSALLCYSSVVMNTAEAIATRITMDSEGFLLKPGELYLGLTEEVTGSEIYSQLLFGDRSIGSLGVWVHIAAPLGHVGSRIRWTLEMRTVKRVRVYPGMKFGKICFMKNVGCILPYGDDGFWNSGRYLHDDITPSLISLDRKLDAL